MSSVDRFKSVNKAIAVLECFNPKNLEISVSEISRNIGIHRVTAYRLLENLVKAGLLEKDDKTGKYGIGPELYVLGNLYLSRTDIFKAAEPVAKKLNEITDEAVTVGILDSVNMIMIIKVEAIHDLRYTPSVGTHIPAHASAIGKALLSELTEKEIDKLFPSENLQKVTVYTINNKTELKQQLENIRKTGLSIDMEGSTLGVVGIASVIRRADGKAIAGISIPVPLPRVTPSVIEKIGQLVKRGASLISYRLGYRDSNTTVRNIQKLEEYW